MNKLGSFIVPDWWTWRMAWRDSLGSRRRLLLFLSSMVIGVAALVAITSFGFNLQGAIDSEARLILGADMSLERRMPFAEATEALIDSLGGHQARQISLASMVLFTRQQRARLMTVRAGERGYPFYGELETDPPSAAEAFLRGRRALVDGGVMRAYGVQVGDSLKVGRYQYQIAGALVSAPRESAMSMLVDPPVYIPAAHLDSTLLAKGARASYEVYFKFTDEVEPEELRDELKDHLDEHEVGLDTIEEEKEAWAEALGYMNRFLGLVAFLALILGGLGIGCALHVHVTHRLDAVAVLRCMGATAARTFRIYLVQALAMGLLAGLAGCAVGAAVQLLLPQVMSEFLPVNVAYRLQPWSLMAGLGTGIVATLVFALLPLTRVHGVTPLHALRAAVEPKRTQGARLLLYALIAGGLTGCAVVQAGEWIAGLIYAGAIVSVFGLLLLMAASLSRMVRAMRTELWRYAWRQGLANLYRPGNQTVLLMQAIGLGTFLIMTVVLVESALVSRLESLGGEGRPDMILFDIQPRELADVKALMVSNQLPVVDESPMVTMRIHAINGRSIDSLRADSTGTLTWAHLREYRSTYRDHLADSETITRGTFIGAHSGPGGIVPVSVEEELAREDLDVGLGDTVVFDVQGAQVTTRIASMRNVDWQQMRSNFFWVFPAGVLETAPQAYILATRTGSGDAEAGFQAALAARFPSVAAISLTLILTVVDAVFDRITTVLRFMALFSIAAGVLVLVGSVMVSRRGRIEETVLLKTLGASRKQVFAIMCVEHLCLGLLATSTGVGLALIAGWALGRFVFEVPFVAPAGPLLLAIVVVTGLTMAVGLASSRGIYDRPSLEVLRSEV